MKIQCTPIDYDYFDFQGKNYAKIIGRDDKGKKVCLIDSCDVFLWAILKDNIGEKKVKEISEKIRKIKLSEKGRASEVIKTEIHNKKYLGKNVTAIKILITNHKDAHSFAEKIDFKEIDKRREFDLPYITRYILEKKLKPLQWYEIEGEILNNSPEFGGIDNKLDVNICLKVEKIKEIEKEIYQPKILSYDIETDEFDIGKGHIVMISLVGENFKKVITWKEKSNKEFVEHVKDESAMLEKCVEYIKDYNPDILVGYFSDGFDLPYLRARAEKNHIKFNIGADDSQPTFTRGRLTTGKIKGIVHIDLFRFIRVTYGQYLQSETLSLNEVALELLGEKKNNWIHKHSSKINGGEWDTYYEYNLQDALLTYKLMQKLWPDFYEFTNVIQEPLFDISRDSLSTQVENYIIHHSGQYNEIIEKRPYNTDIEERRSEEKYEGAFVFQPIPGLYDNVVFFDFTSMYGSVIVTYNLSKSTYLEKKEKDSLKVEMGKETVYFSKEPGFFSLMLQEIIEKRKLFKKEYNENPNPILKARSNAFKLLANAAYGYQGFFGARYYCLKAAAATAALARKSIKETIEVIEKNNNKIIYSDTDSIAFLQGNKTEKDIMDLLKKINETLPGIMELDLEGFYKRGIWVSRRNGDIGAKKKYALIDINDKIKIRGFETVRRDWCNLARETQNKVLDLILKNGDEKKAVELVKEVIEKIKKRDIDLNKLIIKTQLKKSIEEYKSEGPHVTIAKKMREQGKPVNIGMLIEYYIAESDGKKKSLIRERAKLTDEPGKYDIEYYLKNQILPAVENIFEVFNVDVNSLIEKKKQTKLGEF